MPICEALVLTTLVALPQEGVEGCREKCGQPLDFSSAREMGGPPKVLNLIWNLKHNVFGAHRAYSGGDDSTLKKFYGHNSECIDETVYGIDVITQALIFHGEPRIQ